MPEPNQGLEIDPQQSDNTPNPFISLLQNFRFPFPFPAQRQSDPEKREDSGDSVNRTDVVRFSDPRPAVLPPLKIESEESAQSAAIVWQVYALGGYLVARWIWGKWKEKRNKKDGSPDESTPPRPNNN